MGTRSTIRVYNSDEECILSTYIQYDGYPTGVGADLAHFCDGMKIINGFNDHNPGEYANGMGCFAAQLVTYFKDDIGGFYIQTFYPQEYNYEVRESDGHLEIRCVSDYCGEVFPYTRASDITEEFLKRAEQREEYDLNN